MANNKGCKFCSGKKVKYQENRYVNLYIDTFGKHKVLLIEDKKTDCPSNASCGMKNITLNSAFIIDYCPNCGRKLGD